MSSIYKKGEAIGHMGFSRFAVAGIGIADVVGIGGVVVRRDF